MTKEMTSGSPWRLIVSFAWPLFLGNVIQNGYVLFDTMIVGQYLGKEALSAVGSTQAIMFIILGFIFGLTAGIAVITAQYFGAGKPRGVRQSVGTGLWLSAILTVLIILGCYISTRPLLHLLQTPAAIIDQATRYLQVSFIGVLFIVCFNFQSATLRALGDSKTPLIFLAAASILNILLDILFIGVFHYGVEGAAWATNIAILSSAVACYLLVTRKLEAFQLRRSDLRPRWVMARKQLAVSLPMGLQFSITGLGATVLQAAINSFGVILIAGLTAAEKITMIAVQIPVALGQSMATYSAQNYGAGKIHRVRDGVRAGILISTVSGGIITLCALLFGRAFIMLFISEESGDQESILECGQMLLNIAAPFFIPLGYIFIFRNTLQGVNRALYPMLAGVAEMLMRTGVAIGLIPLFGINAVYWADPAAWIGACVMLIPAYLYYQRQWVEGAAIQEPAS